MFSQVYPSSLPNHSFNFLSETVPHLPSYGVFPFSIVWFPAFSEAQMIQYPPHQNLNYQDYYLFTQQKGPEEASIFLTEKGENLFTKGQSKVEHLKDNEDSSSISETKEKPHQNLSDEVTKSRIENILLHILRRDHETERNFLFQPRETDTDPRLQEIFNILVDIYKVQRKPDFKRHVIRKMLIWKIKKIQEEDKNAQSIRSAELIMCKSYFDTPEGNDLEEDQILALLPYRKNSINRTPNRACRQILLASEIFCEDYLEFLNELRDILDAENKKRIEMFVFYIFQCYEQRNLKKLKLRKLFRFIPWLDEWVIEALFAAKDIYETERSQPNCKKIKLEIREDEIIVHQELVVKKEEPLD